MSRTSMQPRRPAPPARTPGATPALQVAAPLLAAPGASHSLRRISISAPADASERQADAVAAQVVRPGESDAPTDAHLGPPLQRKGAAPSASGGGAALDPATRAFMEPRFGHDLSHVRVHTGADAAESALSLSARAFTLGSDISFGSGEYAPGSRAGRELLAHELTHVLQQKSGPASIQRKPRPGVGAAVDRPNADFFESAAARWLNETLDKSAKVTADEKKSLSLPEKGSKPTDGGAAVNGLQQMARWLAAMQDREHEAEARAMHRVAYTSPALAGVDTTNYADQREAANRDPEVQALRRKTLAKQQEFGKVHPVLLSSEINFRDLADAENDKGADMAAARIAQVEQGIHDCRAAIAGGSLTIWDLPDLILEAMAQLGISHKSPLGSAVIDRALANEQKKADHAYWLAVFQIGLGIASLLTMGAGLVVAGGLSDGASLVAGAVTTVPSLLGDGVSIVEDKHAHDQDAKTSNTHLDQSKSLTKTQASGGALAGDYFSLLVDLVGAGLLVKLGHECSLLRGVTTDVERLAGEGHAYRAAHPGETQEVERLLAERAEAQADVLIKEGKIKPGLRAKFVKLVCKAGHERLTGAHPAVEGHPTAGRPTVTHPEPTGAGAAERTTHATDRPARPVEARPLSIEDPANAVPTTTLAETRAKTRAFKERAAARERAKAARAESVKAPVETRPVEASAVEATPAPVEAAPPKTVVTKNGATVTEGGGRPKTIEYEGGARFQEGDGWRDADGKRVYPKTVHPAPPEGLAPAVADAADGPGVGTSMRDAFERSPRKSKAVRDALARPTTEAIPVSAEDTLLAPREGKIVHDTEGGAVAEASQKAKPTPLQDPLAEFPAGRTEHAPTAPVPLADLSEIDAVRAKLNALLEQKEYSVQYDTAWDGSQIKKATQNVSALDGQIGDAQAALKRLEADAHLPGADELRAKALDPGADPLALMVQNQSWTRLGEMGLGADAGRRLLAARDAVVMRVKTQIEKDFGVFIHAGNGERVIDKVTAGKLGTDIDLVISSPVEGGGRLAAMGEGDPGALLADARRELMARLDHEFGGDAGRVALVNAFMADKRLPVLNPALKAAQDGEGIVEGLRGLQQVDPAAYQAQKAALLRESGDGAHATDLLAAAEGAERDRVSSLNAELQAQDIDPAQATKAQKAAAQEQVRQRMEKNAEAALHRYEAARPTAGPDELDALAVEYNRAVQQSAVFTPEAYTPHGALELPLSKRELALGTVDGRALTAPVAAQATLGETRMLLDVVDNIQPKTSQAAHCAKYLARNLNQFLQVVELDRYPMVSRLRSSLEAFQAEMVAVKDVGDEGAKIRRLLDILGDDHRDPGVVAGEFVDQAKQMMFDFNARLVNMTPAAPKAP